MQPITLHVFTIIAFLLTSASLVYAQEPLSPTLKLFSDHPPVFQPPLANPRSPEMALVSRSFEQPNTVTGVIGGRLPLVTLQIWDGNGISDPAFALQLGIDAGSWSQLLLEENTTFPLLAVDYLIGLPLMARYKSLSAMIAISHISAHLGDGQPTRRGRIVYSREFSSFRLAYALEEFGFYLRIYSGGGYIIHTIPEILDPGFAGGGAELMLPKLFDFLSPYGAFDLTWNGDVDSIDTATQLGIYLTSSERIIPSVRLAISTYDGSDRIGQYIGERINYLGLGIHFSY